MDFFRDYGHIFLIVIVVIVCGLALFFFMGSRDAEQPLPDAALAEDAAADEQDAANPEQEAAAQEDIFGIEDTAEPEPLQNQPRADMAGAWVATVINIDFPHILDNAEVQKAELRAIVANIKAAGLNSIFFQVRPQGDALYQSSIFPWSQYLTGEAGKDPGYDPLAYLLEIAHAEGLEVHAWLNPYRLTMGSADSPQTIHDFLPANSPVKDRPDLTLAAGDGRLYLNPGEPEAQALVLDGVREIMENYDVDGIHFDDYFYPSNPDYDDSAAYQKYGQGLSLAEWRRSNTYQLVAEVQTLVHSLSEDAVFGISPSGIWQNAASSELGSATNGFESYNQIYADTRLWYIDGIVDYIAPQLYWAIGQEGSDYAILVDWWHQVSELSPSALYIGHGIYRLDEGHQAWQGTDQVEQQLDLNRNYEGVKGSIFYGYQQIRANSAGIRDMLSDYYNR